MNRFFVPDAAAMAARGRLELTGDDARHAAAVLRVCAGDMLVVCDGNGTDYLCRVEKIDRNAVALSAISTEVNKNEPQTRIFLFQSLSKSDKLEWVAQKAVELGVTGLFTFAAGRSIPKASGATGRHARLARIVEAAAKQSRRGIIPALSELEDTGAAVAKALELAPGGLIAAHETAKTSLKAVLARGRRDALALFVGPEGGFTDGETALFIEYGAALFSLGPRILRTETAGLAAIANILYEYESLCAL